MGSLDVQRIYRKRHPSQLFRLNEPSFSTILWAMTSDLTQPVTLMKPAVVPIESTPIDVEEDDA